MKLLKENRQSHEFTYCFNNEHNQLFVHLFYYFSTQCLFLFYSSTPWIARITQSDLKCLLQRFRRVTLLLTYFDCWLKSDRACKTGLTLKHFKHTLITTWVWLQPLRKSL